MNVTDRILQALSVDTDEARQALNYESSSYYTPEGRITCAGLNVTAALRRLHETAAELAALVAECCKWGRLAEESRGEYRALCEERWAKARWEMFQTLGNPDLVSACFWPCATEQLLDELTA